MADPEHDAGLPATLEHLSCLTDGSLFHIEPPVVVRGGLGAPKGLTPREHVALSIQRPHSSTF